MTGLTDRAVGGDPRPSLAEIERAQERWEQSMRRLLDELRRQVERRSPQEAARAAGAAVSAGVVRLDYWGRKVAVAWPSLEPRFEDGAPLTAFDAGMVLYYLRLADGTLDSGRWIGFRNLPDGAFYHLAYQRYSGDRLAQDFGDRPDSLRQAAGRLAGEPLPDVAPHAFAFRPLPRIRMAAIIWPGDEEFPARGAILFDASASHYMPTDGLALLGGGLAGRLSRVGHPEGRGTT